MNAEIGPDDLKLGWKELVARWLFSQGTSTVLLFCILAAILYSGYYAINEGIPKHLEQIQKGYERIEASHEREHRSLQEIHEKEVESLRKAFQDGLERWDRNHKGAEATSPQENVGIARVPSPTVVSEPVRN